MSGVQMWDSNGSDEELEDFECLDCGCITSEADFESVDDELNRQSPRCPSCQSAHRISREECECGEPATHEVESGFVCDDCHEHYVSGYIRD
jgi:hypothetical protein